jgi:hypothetical protein
MLERLTNRVINDLPPDFATLADKQEESKFKN